MRIRYIMQICILIAALMIFAASSHADIQSGLVAHWKLDETSGSIAHDSTENGNDGTISSATLGAGGKFGTAYSFNGSSDYVDCGNDPSIIDLQQGAVSAWVFLPSSAPASSSGGVLAYGGTSTDKGIFLGTMTNANSSAFDVRIFTEVPVMNKNYLYTDNTFSMDTWYHVIWMSDGSSYKIFVDGNEESFSFVTGSDDGEWFGDISPAGTDMVSIGARKYEGSLGHYLEGTTDDIGVWERTLTQSEIDFLQMNQIPEPVSILFAVAGFAGIALRRRS